MRSKTSLYLISTKTSKVGRISHFPVDSRNVGTIMKEEDRSQTPVIQFGSGFLS